MAKERNKKKKRKADKERDFIENRKIAAVQIAGRWPASYQRYRDKQLGTFGAASPVRHINPEDLK